MKSKSMLLFILMTFFGFVLNVGSVRAVDEVISDTTISCPISGLRGIIFFETNGGSREEHISLVSPVDSRLPIPTKNDETFTGWYYDKELKKRVVTDYVEEVELGPSEKDENGCFIAPQVTLYAGWASIGEPPSIEGGSFLVNFITSGGNTMESISVCIACSGTSSIPVPKRNGYEFIGWYYDENFIEKVNEQYLEDLTYSYSTKSVTIYAKWDEIGKDKKEENPRTGAFYMIFVISCGLLLVIVIGLMNITNYKKFNNI